MCGSSFRNRFTPDSRFQRYGSGWGAESYEHSGQEFQDGNRHRSKNANFFGRQKTSARQKPKVVAPHSHLPFPVLSNLPLSLEPEVSEAPRIKAADIQMTKMDGDNLWRCDTDEHARNDDMAVRAENALDVISVTVKRFGLEIGGGTNFRIIPQRRLNSRFGLRRVRAINYPAWAAFPRLEGYASPKSSRTRIRTGQSSQERRERE